MVRGILVLALVAGCGRLHFDEIDALTNGDGVIQRGCVAQVAARGEGICVRRSDGQVLCWGNNGQGQLGDGTTMEHFVPQPALVTDAIAITSGEQSGCAVRADHRVVCWGAGDSGQLGDGIGGDQYMPVTVVLPAIDPVEVVVAQAHACARLVDGSGWCWGDNDTGALGNPTPGAMPTPVTAPVGNAISLALGDHYTCIVRADKTAACWGNNAEGELGNGTVATTSSPTGVVGITDPVIQVSAGCHRHACALTEVGDVYCWGENWAGELGNGLETAFETTPVRAVGLPPIAQVSVGAYHTCARARNGELWCWGTNTQGELGIGTFTQAEPMPRRVTGFVGTAIDLQAGCESAHVLRDDGTVVGWGAAHKVGTGQTADSTSPVEVDVPCD